MKKILIASSFALISTLISCGGSTETVVVDSVQVAIDTTVVDTTVVTDTVAAQ